MTITNDEITPGPHLFLFLLYHPFASDFRFHTHPSHWPRPQKAPWDSLLSQVTLLPIFPLVPLRPSRPLSPASQLRLPCPSAFPVILRLTRCFSAMPFLKKMQAGPMGNCMEGAGQGSRVTVSGRLPLLPGSLGGSASSSPLSTLPPTLPASLGLSLGPCILQL